MHRRLLITGGSGYLGSHLALLTTQAPSSVRPSAHHAEGPLKSASEHRWQTTITYFRHPVAIRRCRAVGLDVADEKAVAQLMDETRPEVIIHTASDMSAEEMETSIVHGSRHVARAAARIGARLIHLSTDVLFDGEKGNYTDDDPPSPITPYGRAKARAEEAVVGAGGRWVIVRTSLIYGFDPLDRHTRWVVDSLREGNPIHLFTDEYRNPIWVCSLARALLELAAADYTGILHVAGAQALSRYEFGVRQARFCGLDPAGLTPALSRTSGLVRPLDCTLDSSRARALLQTPLPGMDEVLASLKPR